MLFGRHEFDNSYRLQLRSLYQYGSKTISDYASRETYLCSRAYPDFTTVVQLNLATDHFVASRSDCSICDFLHRERHRCQIKWQKIVQIMQASELPPSHDTSAVAQYMAADSYAKIDRVLELLHGLPVVSLAPLANHSSSVVLSASFAAPAKFVSFYCAPTTPATPARPHKPRMHKTLQYRLVSQQLEIVLNVQNDLL